MNHAHQGPDHDLLAEEKPERERGDKQFKKLKRPMHATKRSGAPERLHGIHRRRRKRTSW